MSPSWCLSRLEPVPDLNEADTLGSPVPAGRETGFRHPGMNFSNFGAEK
jgi:hypothetical protein